MAPLRFALGCKATSPHVGMVVSPMQALRIDPLSMERPDDRQAVVTLASQSRAAEPDGHFAPAGLLAELTGRPGRAVHAWLAWPAGTGTIAATGNAVDKGPLGLVALVAAGPVPQVRFSIAWLLVHPDARRRGIATALVAHAMAHAASLGAARVFAETRSSWLPAAGFWRSIIPEQES